MASLSAIRSPSALGHHHNHQHPNQATNGNFNGLSSPSPVILGNNLFLQQQQHQQTHQYHFVPRCPATSLQSNESDENIRNTSNVNGALFVTNPAFRDSEGKVYYDSDFSSPTSWEFRDNFSHHHRPSHLLPIPPPPTGTSQMPTASPSVVLSLPLRGTTGAGASSSSANSSLSTTPSPLDEFGPYQVQMQLSVLRNASNNCHLTIPLSTSNSSCQTPLSLVSTATGQVLNFSGPTLATASESNNCACVFVNSPVSNRNSTMVVANCYGSGDDCGVDNSGPAELHLHDLTSTSNNGNGSDGSRNSTGSHRSQDSGFSDSGEPRRRKSSTSINVSANANANDICQNAHNNSVVASSPPSVFNGSSQHLHYNHQNSIPVCHPCHNQQQQTTSYPPEYDKWELSGNNCCSDRSFASSPSSAPTHHIRHKRGDCVYVPPQQIHHQNSHHIYDCIPSSMPSPILPSGFGCGRLINGGDASDPTSHHHYPHPVYGIVLSNHGNGTVPRPRRPASVDISTLDRNGNCNGGGGMVSKLPTLQSPVTTSCSNCLPSSISNSETSMAIHRRSFSPSSRIHNHPFHSHDISALASSTSATAMAALRVPLSSSTPKRGSSSSTSKLSNGHGSNNVVVKIDNFESLNKNVNKDNNNNSSGNGSAKTGNKTFTIQQLSTSSKDLSGSPRSGSRSNYSGHNGTVLAEDGWQQASSSHDAAAEVSSASRESASHANKQRTRSAAESIYDKICSRLSSFSSSTSSAGSLPSTPQCNMTTVSENQTIVPANKSKGSLSKDNSTKCTDANIDVAPHDCGNGSAICENSSQSNNVSKGSSNDSNHAPSTSSRFKLFTRTSSAKWQSLPRGVTPKKLSLKEERKEDDATLHSLGRNETKDTTNSTLIKEEQKDETSLPINSITSSREAKVASSNVSWKKVEDRAGSQVVRLWLQDLRTQTEPECLHSLQTKWIISADSASSSQGEEEGDEDGGTLRLTSQSSATYCTIKNSIATFDNDGTRSVMTLRDGRISSSSSTSHQPFSSQSPTDIDSGTLSSLTSECPQSIGHLTDVELLGSIRQTSSNMKQHRHHHQQQQRRSQQKFLSSMTAAIHAVSTPLMSIRNVEMTANIISGEFSKICKHLEFGIFTQVPTLVVSLVGHIDDFLRGNHVPAREICVGGSGFNMHLKKLEGRLESSCYALDMAAKSMSEAAILMNASDTGEKGSGRNSTSCHQSHHQALPHSSSTSSPLLSSSATSPQSSSPTSSSDSSNNDLIPGPSNSHKIGNGRKDSFNYRMTSSSSSSEQDSIDRHYNMVVGEVVEGIVTVGNLFSQVVDLRLTRDLASILDTIESGGIPARIALKSLTTVLADGGNHICRLAADIRTVRGLLGVLLDTREDQDKILALRCLATVLCVGEAVKDFDKAGGFEIVADLLFDPIYSTSMKIEAVAVLTQATDPWIDIETTLITLGVHLEKFIVSLTKLIGEFKTEEEPFLLIAAAISNLTFLEVASTEHLKRCRTVSFLIEAVKGNPTFSVFVLDHIATILANMAGVETCRQEIIQCGGIDALLHFLQQRPSLPGNTDTASAITACERLQQKSTIAISRLANEDGVARYIFNKGGVHRLITLCRKEKERNYSDGVLIAALATLRKLLSMCGEEAASKLGGAEDLIEPRLLDSFLLYSSRQESYV